METTPRLGLYRPDGTDPFRTSDFQHNYDVLDSAPGIMVVTDGSLPGSPWTGQTVYDTTQSSLLTYDGFGWSDGALPVVWNHATTVASPTLSTVGATWNTSTTTIHTSNHASCLTVVGSFEVQVTEASAGSIVGTCGLYFDGSQVGPLTTWWHEYNEAGVTGGFGVGSERNSFAIHSAFINNVAGGAHTIQLRFVVGPYVMPFKVDQYSLIATQAKAGS